MTLSRSQLFCRLVIKTKAQGKDSAGAGAHVDNSLVSFTAFSSVQWTQIHHTMRELKYKTDFWWLSGGGNRSLVQRGSNASNGACSQCWSLQFEALGKPQLPSLYLWPHACNLEKPLRENHSPWLEKGLSSLLKTQHNKINKIIKINRIVKRLPRLVWLWRNIKLCPFRSLFFKLIWVQPFL